VLNLVSKLFASKKTFKIQSFTYFIPSPPARASGYREKQFDKLFYEFINKGYNILNFSTQASTGDKHSGMWVLFIVQALNKEAEALNIDEVLIEALKTKIAVKEKIDGLYYIDDQTEIHD
jgi:hypothetical protein